MKILFRVTNRVTKMHKKEDGYYPVTIEFGVCSECSRELNLKEKAYLRHEHIICLQCYRKRKEN